MALFASIIFIKSSAAILPISNAGCFTTDNDGDINSVKSKLLKPTTATSVGIVIFLALQYRIQLVVSLSALAKMASGSGWWFLDQKDGMVKQMNALSNMGLLNKFVGMLTDSRSFMSFPCHEYFRRLLCNLFGKEIENGELPNVIGWVGKIIKDICFYNAQNYFG